MHNPFRSVLARSIMLRLKSRKKSPPDLSNIPYQATQHLFCGTKPESLISILCPTILPARILLAIFKLSAFLVCGSHT